MTDAYRLLLPRPRSIRPTGDAWAVGTEVVIGGAAAPAARERLERALEATGRRTRHAGHVEEAAAADGIRLQHEDGGDPEAYRLIAGAAGVTITGADAGLFYGAATLCQWIGLHAGAPGAPLVIPGIAVDDRPAFRHRGVLLDVSRNKVPTAATLRSLVELLAGWKVNQLQLYTEHTFAYSGHEVVWRDASPVTPAEARDLDAWCAARHIELVPNQNSFGHLHRWLRHEPYRRLAEVPEGLAHPWGDEPEPFGLCPLDPGSLELLGDLFDQLLPCFASRQLNAGLDETLDLGLGRSAAACAERGKERVYLEFLRAVRDLLDARGHRMQFWADIALEHPALIAEIPQDAIPLVWGYEADHPFAAQAESIAAAGLELYVCPGTSSWISLAGRGPEALANLEAAAAAGRASGAAGYLITDWGDLGHLQPLPVSYPALAAGAALAWNATAPPVETDLPELLAAHALGGSAELAAALWELAGVYRLPGPRIRNGSVLFYLLAFPRHTLTPPRYGGLGAAGLEAARSAIAAAAARLRAVPAGGVDTALVRSELRWVADGLDLASRLGLARLAAGADRPLAELPQAVRRELARDLERLRRELPGIWLARNRPGGLADSDRRFAPLAALLTA